MNNKDWSSQSSTMDFKKGFERISSSTSVDKLPAVFENLNLIFWIWINNDQNKI